MSTIILPAIFTALSVYVLCCYMGVRTAAGYHVILDVGLSVSLAILYAGTFSGTVTAFLAGLTLSALFIATRHFVGYRRLTTKGWREFPPKFNIHAMWKEARHPTN